MIVETDDMPSSLVLDDIMILNEIANLTTIPAAMAVLMTNTGVPVTTVVLLASLKLTVPVVCALKTRFLETRALGRVLGRSHSRTQTEPISCVNILTVLA
jgi:hypothetical protein